MIVRFIKKLLITIFGFILVYIVIALVLSFIPTNPPKHICQQSQTIYVATNGVHLDYIIPTSQLDAGFLEKLNTPHGVSYLGIGWGDKEFYMKTPEWSDLNAWILFKALFVKTPAAVHVRYYERSQTHWVAIELCDHQLQIIKEYIESEFKIYINGYYRSFPGYGPNDRFFDAQGRFLLHKTCNVWVNQGLKEADIKTSVWSPFDFGVLYHLNK